MSRFHRRVDASFHALVVLLGSWTLFAQACALVEVSFATLRAFSFLPLLFSTVVVWTTSGPPRPLEASASVVAPMRRRPVLGNAMWLGAPFALAAVYAVTWSDWLFWLLATSYLTAETWFGQRSEGAREEHDPPESRLELGVLLALCALAALLTSGVRRPDADDAYYLSVATAAVEFPDAAPLSLDTLHRSGLPPLEQMVHLPQTYEILVGLLASVSGVSLKTLYYVLLPPFWAVLGTLANWLVLGHLLRRREAIWGTAIFVFLLVFWGDGHRTFGNFGFVRLFQGKAIYVTVVLPLVILAALRYRQRPGVATWLTLAFSQCAGAGLTASGVVVAPLAAALAVLVPPGSGARWLRTNFVGIAASLPLLVVAAAMYVRIAPYVAGMGIGTLHMGYSVTLGDVRTPLVLLVLTVLPVLAARARLKCTNWIAGYVWLVVLVIFMPVASTLASMFLGGDFGWRLFWSVPMPLVVSLAGGIAAGAIAARNWGPVGALVVWAAVFAVAGPMAVSSGLFSIQNLGRWKVDDGRYAVAEQVVALAHPERPALVPQPVAVWVTGFSHAPPLVGVRGVYLRRLRGFIPADQLASRVALFQYSEGVNAVMSVSDALEAIEAHGIATLVFPEVHRDASALVAALAGRGFAIHPLNGYVIAARPK